MKLAFYVVYLDPCVFKQIKGLSKMDIINFTSAAGAGPSSFTFIQPHYFKS